MPRERCSNTIRTDLNRVPSDLFKFTTTDENGVLVGSVGADLRAAISLTPATAATGDGGHSRGGHP